MNKEDIKEGFKAAAKAARSVAKATGNLAKTGINALSDRAEHNRQMTVIDNQNQKAAAAKASAMVPFLIGLSPYQRKLVDPLDYYGNVPGQVIIPLDLPQEDAITLHRIAAIKTAGGQNFNSLMEEVLKEHATDACQFYLYLRYELARLWLSKAIPGVNVKTPEDAVAFGASLNVRYGVKMSPVTMETRIVPLLKNIWNNDSTLIQFAKSWGLHSFCTVYSNNILTIKLK